MRAWCVSTGAVIPVSLVLLGFPRVVPGKGCPQLDAKACCGDLPFAKLRQGTRPVSGASAAAGVEVKSGTQHCLQRPPTGGVASLGHGQVPPGVDHHCPAARTAVPARGSTCLLERGAACQADQVALVGVHPIATHAREPTSWTAAPARQRAHTPPVGRTRRPIPLASAYEFGRGRYVWAHE
jgi:hypothetical protein